MQKFKEYGTLHHAQLNSPIFNTVRVPYSIWLDVLSSAITRVALIHALLLCSWEHICTVQIRTPITKTQSHTGTPEDDER